MTFPTFVVYGALKIVEEEPTLPFIHSPPPFSSPNKVVSCTYFEVGKLVNQITNPLIPSSFLPMDNILSRKTLNVLINPWSLR